MSRRKLRSGAYHYQCTHSTHDQSTECPVGESFYEKELEAVVFNALNQYLAPAQKDAVQNRDVGDLRKSAIKECADNIRSLQRQAEQLKAAKLRLYEKHTAYSITREEYIRQKKEADAKIAECEETIRRGHERMQELDSEQSCSDENLDAVCNEYKSSTALTHAFISAIYVHDHNNIEIVWKFKDFFKTIG